MSNLTDRLLALTRQLYPTGRAFRMPEGGFLEGLHIATNTIEAQAITDAISIHDSILPDNANFTAQDASDWERRLGLIDRTGDVLASRMLAIQRKLNYPGRIEAKGSYMYLQEQLQAAGFPVYVFENRFATYPSGYITKSPIDITGDYSLLSWVEHGEVEHGEVEHGYFWNNIIANHVDQNRDFTFDVGANLRSTFYICGYSLGTYVSLPIAQKDAFRQLVLKIKPVQTVAFTFLNFI